MRTSASSSTRALLGSFAALCVLATVPGITGCGAADSCGDHRACKGADQKDGAAADSADGSSDGHAAASDEGGSSSLNGDASADGGADSEREGGDASSEGGSVPDAEPPCDEMATPSESACVVSEQFAVFVASPLVADAGSAADAGSDAGDAAEGTREDPAPTILEGIQIARRRGMSRVIICNATYDETVVLDAENAGISLFGGFRCPGDAEPWTYSGTEHARVVAPGNERALTISDVREPLRIEDIDFTARNASLPGRSSIAAMVTNAADVRFLRVKLTAGRGADGADGTVVDATWPAATALAGATSTSTASGFRCESRCALTGPAWDAGTILVSYGGHGGWGGTSTATGGFDGLPYYGTGTGSGFVPDGGGVGGLLGAACAGTGRGVDGSVGFTVPAGSGATTRGSLVGTTWSPSGGKDGSSGTPGQGGGGGAGTSTGAGGNGACGGCGGSGGGAGAGGGASIALIAVGSGVTLTETRVTAVDAGGGGTGHVGQTGQSGGQGGGGYSTACAGGSGGKGGNGAAGGSGAGGVSVGVLFRGTAPTLDADTTSHVTVGAPGLGGPEVGGFAGTNGIDGLAQDIYEVP